MVAVVLTGERAVVSTLAGGVWGGGYSDGVGTNAGFFIPAGVAVDASGNVFVADLGNQRIRTVTAGAGTRIRVGAVSLGALTARHERERNKFACIQLALMLRKCF